MNRLNVLLDSVIFLDLFQSDTLSLTCIMNSCCYGLKMTFTLAMVTCYLATIAKQSYCCYGVYITMVTLVVKLDIYFQ